MTHTPYCNIVDICRLKPYAVRLAPAGGRDMGSQSKQANKNMHACCLGGDNVFWGTFPVNSFFSVCLLNLSGEVDHTLVQCERNTMY